MRLESLEQSNTIDENGFTVLPPASSDEGAAKMRDMASALDKASLVSLRVARSQEQSSNGASAGSLLTLMPRIRDFWGSKKKSPSRFLSGQGRCRPPQAGERGLRVREPLPPQQGGPTCVSCVSVSFSSKSEVKSCLLVSSQSTSSPGGA